MGVGKGEASTQKEPALQGKTAGRKTLYVVLPVLLTIVQAVVVWISEPIYVRDPHLGSRLTHTILVVLAFLGIIASKLSLAEAGIISPNPRYSLYWGLYLSMSVCVPALAFVSILNASGLVSLETSRLNVYILADALVINFVSNALCEELFFMGYVLGSLNRAIGHDASPIVSGIIFGAVHLVRYANPLTGKYSLDAGAVVWVLISCFVGIYFGLLRRKCGDIYCPTLFHGSQDFTMNVMSILKCPENAIIMAMGVGWVIFLTITYRQFKKSKVH
ncbi:CPBP family intramembrane glutamic endopeptidase [Infirmifilum sp. NZ]|uniref:CPBP family intramembrane glutamic endopeptidase n=1 Tax=Infirmifilum sp. NZ TaxID=2926850 RepID=UPI002799C8EC|nr:type II CAAX endopeptidase family protein [Infirmifilum sp. NZ]UNQ73713.1 CPBP family intramembrane metalloprotease [Infirmifilum sp. NZ]